MRADPSDLLFNDSRRTWHGQPPAHDRVLLRLREQSPVPLPDEYLGLLRRSNGGEGPLPINPLWFVLWPAEEVVGANRDYDLETFLPGFFAFGSSGGGEVLCLDARAAAPWPVCTVPAVGMEAAVRTVATDFPSFLALVGVE